MLPTKISPLRLMRCTTRIRACCKNFQKTFWFVPWISWNHLVLDNFMSDNHQSINRHRLEKMLLATSWSCLVAPRTAVGRTTAASADALARIFSSAKSRRRSKTSEEILSPTGGRWMETLKKVSHGLFPKNPAEAACCIFFMSKRQFSPKTH